MPDVPEILEALGIGLQRGGQAGFGAAQFQDQQRRQKLLDMLNISAQRQTQEFRQGQVGRAEEGLSLERDRLDLARRGQVFKQFESNITGAQKAMEPGKQLTRTQVEGLALQKMFETDPQFQQDYVNAMLSKLTKSGQPKVTTGKGRLTENQLLTRIGSARKERLVGPRKALENIDFMQTYPSDAYPLTSEQMADSSAALSGKIDYLLSPQWERAYGDTLQQVLGGQSGINPAGAPQGGGADIDEIIRRLEDELSREP